MSLTLDHTLVPTTITIRAPICHLPAKPQLSDDIIVVCLQERFMLDLVIFARVLTHPGFLLSIRTTSHRQVCFAFLFVTFYFIDVFDL
jgi:hypothetical protein